MKKVVNRSLAVTILAIGIIAGLLVYITRFFEQGENWALYFPGTGDSVEGSIYDRGGNLLASFNADEQRYSDYASIREACYHVTGDYGGRVGSGLISSFWNGLRHYDIINGVTISDDTSISLTVDSSLNIFAYNLLAGRCGAIMMMNYKTGEILTMASSPSLDPLAEEDEELPEGVFINRCVNATYAPGSVFKLITSAAAIENLDNLDEQRFYCDGDYITSGVLIKCSGEHYNQNFEQALANSCNVAFAQISIQVGQERLIEYAEKYGFLSELNIDYMRTSAGHIMTEYAGDPETAWIGIGQSEDLITPYAMMRYVAAIANGGMLVRPHIIYADTVTASRLIEESTANRLKELMINNVEKGYGSYYTFPDLKIGGKTGTGETGYYIEEDLDEDGDPDSLSNVWFTGFLYDEEHPWAFVAVIEKDLGGGLTTTGVMMNTFLHQAIKSMS